MSIGSYVGPCAHFVPAGEFCQYCHGTGPAAQPPQPQREGVIDRIGKLLHDDPACKGRVTVDTIMEIAALVAFPSLPAAASVEAGERAQIVAPKWLHAEDCEAMQRPRADCTCVPTLAAKGKDQTDG